MTPETKFHSLVLGLTVVVMFWVIVLLVPYVQEAPFMQAPLVQYPLVQASLGAIFALLLSAGIYGLIAKGLVVVLRRSRWLKAKLLGPYYMEGTWAGHFIGHQNDIRYVVEVFEQDFSSLTIMGKSYTVAHDMHAQWTSEATYLDVEHARLIYASSLDVFSRKITVQSIVVFQLERESANDAPHAMEGYTADLDDGTRIWIREEKINEQAMAHRDAIRQAKEITNRNLANLPDTR